MSQRRVLVVDDDADMSLMLARHLESEGMAVVAATGGREALKALAAQEFDVVVTDLVMDEVGGLEVLEAAGQCRDAPRVILMTAFGTLESAIAAMRQGAYDYLAKPFKLAEVTVAVSRALDDHRLRRENERLRAEVERHQGLDRLLGRSKIMQEAVSQIRAVAASDSSVLLLGESGTGKELVAQAIHWASPRRGGRFLAVNCAAVPETLLESELFGHEKGAFTGADRRREGLFAAANGGTPFLDQSGDMPLAAQAKPLPVLQDRAVRPLGGTASLQLDLRVVAATNKELAPMIKDGRFREDLYYRLAVIPIRLPSLRERPEDIMLIGEHYLRETSGRLGKHIEGFDEPARGWMERRPGPANVREHENVSERAVVLARPPRITRADLGTEFTLDESSSPFRPTLATLEGQYVRRVLEEVRGDKVAAAKILGVSVRTLQRRFQEPPPPPPPPGSPSPRRQGVVAYPPSRPSRAPPPPSPDQRGRPRAPRKVTRSRGESPPVSTSRAHGLSVAMTPGMTEPSARPRIDAPRIMIVDDDAEMRALLRDALEREGFRVHEHAAAEGLMPLIASWAPHVVVLDKVMTGSSGLDVLRHLHRDHPETPVVFVTAF